MKLFVHTLNLIVGSELVQKVSVTFAAQVLRLLVTLIISVVVSRMLGPSNRGLFAVALTTGALGVQFGNLGLHASNTYFAARDRSSLPLLIGNSLLVSFGFGSLLALTLWFLLRRHPIWTGLQGWTLALALMWIPLGLACLLGENLLLGIHQVRMFNVAEILNRMLQLALILALIALRHRTVEEILGAMLAGLLVTCLFVFRWLWRESKSRPIVSSKLMREHIGYAIKAYLTTFFCFVVIRADLILVQKFVGLEQAGYYSVAANLADALLLLPTTIAMILFPKLSMPSDVRSKLHLTWRASILAGAMLLPAFLGLAFLSRTIVADLFGRAFLPASSAFVLLLPGIFCLSLHSVIVQFLNGIGYPSEVVWIWGFSAILNIALNWFVIPRFGILGASVVSSACYFVSFLAVATVILRIRASVRDKCSSEGVAA